MLLVPQTAAAASNVILLCYSFLFFAFSLTLVKEVFPVLVVGERVLGGAVFFFYFSFCLCCNCFVFLYCLPQLPRGGTAAILAPLSAKYERRGSG